MVRSRLLSMLAAAAIGLNAPPVSAAGIAIVAPQSGHYGALGRQIIDGATAAAKALGVEITEVDESCETGSGTAIGEILRDAKVNAAIGFLCGETLEGSLAILKDAKIPAITVSVRGKIVIEDALKYGWPLFRLAPSSDAEAQALTEIILRDWQGNAFALLEDGTIHGRELAEAIRNALELRGMKPAFTDTYRPSQEQQVALVRRLKKAGITHAFVGGDRNDVAIIARDAASESIPLTLLGGDAMTAANQPVLLADGTLAVTLPGYAAMPTVESVAARLRNENIEPEGYVLPAYAALEMAVEAAKRSATEAKPLAETLVAASFATVIGPIAFTKDHELSENPYRLQVWQDNHFVALNPSQE
ncbi:MAG: branched-chain amino acid ABC transporter substrate-binding protein [Allorhizobium sp.]